jgi:hypothetical protein
MSATQHDVTNTELFISSALFSKDKQTLLKRLKNGHCAYSLEKETASFSFAARGIPVLYKTPYPSTKFPPEKLSEKGFLWIYFLLRSNKIEAVHNTR